MNPLRLAILNRTLEPRSSTAVAAELGLPRQKVNYHVRELARHAFLRDAGRRRRGNLYEQRWRASARAYLIGPEVLTPVEADWRSVDDRNSAAYLLALAARTQREVAQVAGAAEQRGQRLSTLSVTVDVRFSSAEQRTRFAVDLRDAIARVVSEHTDPMHTPRGDSAPGPPVSTRVRLPSDSSRVRG